MRTTNIGLLEEISKRYLSALNRDEQFTLLKEFPSLVQLIDIDLDYIRDMIAADIDISYTFHLEVFTDEFVNEFLDKIRDTKNYLPYVLILSHDNLIEYKLRTEIILTELKKVIANKDIKQAMDIYNDYYFSVENYNILSKSDIHWIFQNMDVDCIRFIMLEDILTYLTSMKNDALDVILEYSNFFGFDNIYPKLYKLPEDTLDYLAEKHKTIFFKNDVVKQFYYQDYDFIYNNINDLIKYNVSNINISDYHYGLTSEQKNSILSNITFYFKLSEILKYVSFFDYIKWWINKWNK